MSRWLVTALGRALGMVLNSPAGPWLRRQVGQAVPVVKQALASSAQALPQGMTVPEITPLVPRRAGFDGGAAPRRINLLIPALSERHVFGGIATALRVFEAMQHGVHEARIVVMDEALTEPSPQSWYGQWPQVRLEDDQTPPRHVVCAGDRYQRTLPVSSGDVFVATAWWTAHAAHRLLQWQMQAHGAQAPQQFVYLIQDYEPGFYSWSSHYALAAATYGHGSRIRAIVNTRMLADYLGAQGHRFDRVAVLEPRLNPALAQWRNSHPVVTKERVMLVYARPSVERNGLSLLLMALQRWVAMDPQAAAGWQVCAAGEAFADIELGHGLLLRNLGKLSLQDYAQWLARCSVGFSVMISPHPSYPPLEMAAFGARVVTNGFANKNLSELSDRITSVEDADPDRMAQAIASACAAFVADPAPQIDLRSLQMAGHFLSPGAEVPDLRHVMEGWA